MTIGLSTLLAGCAPAQRLGPIYTVPSGRLAWVAGIPVLILHGSPYEMGYQHGALLQEEVHASVDNAMAFVDGQIKVPLAGRWFARRALDRAWNQMAPFVPLEIQQELQGLADGAGVSLRDLQRVHALPELMSSSCSSFAAFGQATREGRMIQARNLDWAIQSNVQRYSALFVYHPAGREPFISIGWLGFIGVISGINQRGISVAEIGAKTKDARLKGTPMPFLLRRVLEQALDLEEAVSIIRTSPRTGGYNYLFANSTGRRAVALETTRSQAAVFWADQEPKVPFALYVPNAIFRSDWALDPAVRDLQTASRGNPSQAGLESPVGSTAYDVRYCGMGTLLQTFHGKIDPEVAMAIARAVAPSSNIQSIIYAAPELWIANPKDRQPAAMGTYHRVDMEDLFKL
ncbi:MAG: hypothetical protein HY211_03360 [Candidatus Omnitrophica bacterium]|nr:hypothetical protein [Candidatus Omnitrophota bacterium]